MAPQVGGVLELQEHAQRLLQALTMPVLAGDRESPAGRRARKAVESGLYRHLWEALESWQEGPRHAA